jgi:hypothetical protein
MQYQFIQIKAVPIMKSYSARILAVIAVVSVIVNVLLYFRYSTNRPLVTVGDTVITKKQYFDQLEHDAGQQVLTKLVFGALVNQAAARAGVVPTTQDVQDRLQMIRRQSPQILSPYSQDPAKMAQFQQDLTTSMALENLRIRDVALTPAQIADYYARHKAVFALPQQIMTTTVVTQNALDAGTAAELLRQNDPPDVIARQSGLRVVGIGGYSPDLLTLPPPLKSQINGFVQSAKVGEVKTFHAGAFFLTFRVTGSKPAVVPPLAQVREQVERAARLTAAPSQTEELARLYQAAHPTFSVDKYMGDFAAVQQYPVGADNGKGAANPN